MRGLLLSALGILAAACGGEPKQEFAVDPVSAVVELREGITEQELTAPTRVVMLGTGTPIPDAYRAGARDIGPAFRDTFGKHFPSMTMVQVVALLDPDAMVEIECFAVVED